MIAGAEALEAFEFPDGLVHLTLNRCFVTQKIIHFQSGRQGAGFSDSLQVQFVIGFVGLEFFDLASRLVHKLLAKIHMQLPDLGLRVALLEQLFVDLRRRFDV